MKKPLEEDYFTYSKGFSSEKEVVDEKSSFFMNAAVGTAQDFCTVFDI